MANELTPYQKDILVKTILSEARGEGSDGMAAVAHVIANRANSGQFSSDPAAVALQPNQFSGWRTGEGGNNPNQFQPGTRQYNQALQIIENVFSGQTPDPTNGALYYHTPAVSPSWSGSVNRYGTNQIGNHIFYNGRPTPPGEIPNQVASLTDTTPRIAPTPATSSPDLALMRNPVMSSSARQAQVTPVANVPLPRSRPSVPDIVTPTMASLARPAGNVNATRGVDMIAASQNPYTPRLADAGDNIYSYHIQNMTPTTVTGGLGSLTPSANILRQLTERETAEAPGGKNIAVIPTTRQQVRLPDLPPSNIGQPPTTRVVQSVPVSTSSAPKPSTSQLQQAARRAALTANQSYVDRTPPPRANTPGGSAVNNIREQQLEQLGQRAATNIPSRLSPGAAAQNYDVAINGPPGLTRQQFAALPTPPARAGLAAPTPLPANARPLAARNLAPARTIAPAPQAAPAPLRIVVNGGNQVASALATQPVAPQPMTVVQALMAQGLSPSQAYDTANARARGPTSLEDRVSGRGTSASSGASAYSISG